MSAEMNLSAVLEKIKTYGMPKEPKKKKKPKATEKIYL